MQRGRKISYDPAILMQKDDHTNIEAKVEIVSMTALFGYTLQKGIFKKEREINSNYMCVRILASVRVKKKR